MNIKNAYNTWAHQYDTNENKTRDLEAQALRHTLDKATFESCLEIGCGTGKNTEWLSTKAAKVTAIDLSDEMLAKAKQKIVSGKVQFIQADITHPWTFRTSLFDLVTFSLVLEHIKELEQIFKEATASLKTGGHVYVGELHPFKQYTGSKARFETADGLQIVQCYNHNISDFIAAAKNNGLILEELNEFFDDNDRTTMPRILTLVFRKA
jgi:ubiquinone/menaquinone biosynthesis C-methylase UbiE